MVEDTDDSDLDEMVYCSNCKKEIPVSNAELHTMRCFRLTLCELCDEMIPSREFQEHKLKEHPEVNCELCGAPYPQSDLDTHKGSCPKTPVLCSFCSLEYPKDTMAEHLERCGTRTDTCELCGRRDFVRNLPHFQCTSVTSPGQTTSPYSAKKSASTEETLPCLICSMPVPRSTMAEHIDYCGSRTDVCDKCGQRVILVDFPLHPCRDSSQPTQSTSPYAIKPTPPPRDDAPISDFGHITDLRPSRAEVYHERGGADFGDLLDTVNGSQINFDEALAAQLAHDANLQQSGLYDPSSYQRPAAPPAAAVVDSDDALMLPCEFCTVLLPFEDLIQHQSVCQLSPPPSRLETPDPKIPCEFCSRHFPANLIKDHQATCTPTRRPAPKKGAPPRQSGITRHATSASTNLRPSNSTNLRPSNSTTLRPSNTTTRPSPTKSTTRQPTLAVAGTRQQPAVKLARLNNLDKSATKKTTTTTSSAVRRLSTSSSDNNNGEAAAAAGTAASGGYHGSQVNVNNPNSRKKGNSSKNVTLKNNRENVLGKYRK